MGYATLSRSRTYIMVPRDVPPENFVTVQETRKVERVGLARCLLPPCLVVGCLLLLASILAAVGFLLSIKTYEANTETGKTLWSNRQQGDEAIYCGEGEWGSLKCHPCLCSKIGSLSKACHRGSGQCTCKEGHSGHKCDICPQVFTKKMPPGIYQIPKKKYIHLKETFLHFKIFTPGGFLTPVFQKYNWLQVYVSQEIPSDVIQW